MIEILYQDENIVIVNKPAVMLVHRSLIDSQETIFLLQTLRDQIGQYVYPVHRLDRPTSGIIIFALNEVSARKLKVQFDQKLVEKTYLAVVRGWLDSQQINYPLSMNFDPIADQKANHQKLPKTAITDVFPIAKVELPFAACTRYETSRYTLVELIPHTGRKHQLRRHLKHIFHPIIGDTAYGDLRQNKAFLNHLDIKRLLLHATKLSFCHPITEEKMSFTCLPEDKEWKTIQELFKLDLKSIDK
ncbi:tRNA pseudouridine(65) synthase TruC [Suttonella ornithocola]|uniref:tRNA pseudouridine(65) synthase TruC n=1 Tax=Suttonella ornithocola TaxID=279832 RepID=UPI000A03FBE2